MNIQTYISDNRNGAKPPKAEIVKRWQSRIVARSLHTQGRSGAAEYLESYGKNISARKVIDLALAAEHYGAPLMAAGFWEAAYTLETGNREVAIPGAEASTTESTVAAPANSTWSDIGEFPPELQPGAVVTMQPIDAPNPQSHYLTNPIFWGQPKRDGLRNVVFSSGTTIAHQSRSHGNLPALPLEFHNALKETAKKAGPFVLDTERTFLDAAGGEHRTAAQAATTNIELDRGDVQPIARCCIFGALFAYGKSYLESSAAHRIAAAEALGKILAELAPEHLFEIVPTARTTAEKIALVSKQTAECREGEVWFRHDTPYIGGKEHDAAFRTKYLTEVPVIVTALTETTAPNRVFGALEVVSADGSRKPLGKVGSGFDVETAKLIAARFAADPEGLKIIVLSQGFTEGGRLWHPRFLQFAA